MIPIETIDCNFTYTAPAGMTSKQVGDLHCRRHDGAITSYWQADETERRHIASGGLIAYTVHSHTHPVVSLAAMPSRSADVSPAAPSSDYQQSYQENWRDIIEPDGNLDMDALKRELHDYLIILKEVSTVYDEITQGRFSKANTTAMYIIDEVNRRIDEPPNTASKRFDFLAQQELAPAPLSLMSFEFVEAILRVVNRLDPLPSSYALARILTTKLYRHPDTGEFRSAYSGPGARFLKVRDNTPLTPGEKRYIRLKGRLQ